MPTAPQSATHSRVPALDPRFYDPRNDEHVVLAGMHVAMLRFHNAVVDRVRAGAEPEPEPERMFAEARRSVTWHDQWIVLRELLPSIVGQALVDDVLRRGRVDVDRVDLLTLAGVDARSRRQ